ncbi:AAA family ATPase [Desulfobacter latus]|uniref:AAA family ATPase n=1 Tax=Desulfobacter latus TaxID=2292 RepID=A0A850SWM3_9BACT|nr:AAA family ATPase [Desulfobacter latus]NWH05724.1 AAA family ATPase [Desulfobacter latus]
MSQAVEQMVEQVSRVILGKAQQIRLALACFFARGHLLIEDYPGIGKTTLAKTLAKCMGLDFQRMQFTSDLLPGDILGVSVFDRNTAGFTFHPGPIFTQVFLVDEINRATPKSQSALLEAMEEGQVTVEGESRPLNTPFFVIATQNPLEQAGTFPLPESQMDRFLMRLSLGYPDRRAEKRILKGEGSAGVIADLACCMENTRVSQIQDEVAQVHASDHFLEYLQDILEFTRTSGEFQLGLSPRAGLSLLRAAKAWAYIMGRDYTIPEDLQEILPWVVGHRLRLRHDLGHLSGKKLMDLFSRVRIPV